MPHPTPPPPPPPPQGLDADGWIVREGDAAHVPPAFAPLVRGYVELVTSSFPGLHSVYLYGSLPRGTARPGVSDLDGQVLLDREPTQGDHEVRRAIETELARAYPAVDGVGILLDPRAEMLDPANRHDHGFHLRVLCAPVWGPDAGAEVAPHRPDLDLARGVQGQWRAVLERLRREGAAPGSPRVYSRAVGRRLARIAFTWVMPRWAAWTSDPALMNAVVSALEPAWAEPMARAVELGWHGRADVVSAVDLLDGWAVELQDAGTALGA